MKLAPLFLAIALVGCGGGAIANVTGDATRGAITALDTPAAKRQEADAAQNAAGAAAQGAVNVVTSPETEKRLVSEEIVLGTTVRAELAKALDDAEKRVRALLEELTALLERLPAVAGDAREQMTGAPLRADIDAAAPHLAKLVSDSAAAARAQADAEIAKWKWVAIVVAIVAVVMMLLHAHAVRELRRAR